MSELTDSLPVVARFWKTRLTGSLVDLGLKDVFYGDQRRIPNTPTVCVEPNDVTWELNGDPRRTRVMLSLYFLVYHSEITTAEEIREDNDSLADDLKTFINRSEDCDGLIVHGYVRALESGVMEKRKTMFRATRITWEGLSQVTLPSSIAGTL